MFTASDVHTPYIIQSHIMSIQAANKANRENRRSFRVEGPKTEKAREPTVESLMRGMWSLRAEPEETVPGGWGSTEDSHRDKTEEQYA